MTKRVDEGAVRGGLVGEEEGKGKEKWGIKMGL